MYCELIQNKKRTCKVTSDAKKNSSECEFEQSKKKCYIKKQNVKPQPKPVNVNVAGPSEPRFCKLNEGKRRTCETTFNSSEDSKECMYDRVKKKCYINKTKKEKSKQLPKPNNVQCNININNNVNNNIQVNNRPT